MDTNTLPLGTIKQAIMKIDSANTDLHELMADDGIPVEDKSTICQMSEMLCSMEAALLNITAAEISDSEFLSEDIIMDDIEPFPESNILSDDI